MAETMVVYRIRNVLNGKCYTGQTIRTGRFKEHQRNLRKNRHINSTLQAAWNKYGEENFVYEVIANAKTLDELNILEEYYVAQTLVPIGYNLKGGGKNKKYSKESKIKMSKALTGPKNPMFGKTKLKDEIQSLENGVRDYLRRIYGRN